MKKLFKFFIFLLISLLSLIIILSVVAKLSENKIKDIALKRISENIEAPILIDNISFHLIRKFPLATIELNNVILGAPESAYINDSATHRLDTIIYLHKIFVSVKSRPLLNSVFDIVKIDVDGATINYLADSTGRTNIDFLLSTEDAKDTDTSKAKPIDLTLTDLSLKNVICNYNDRLINAKATIKIPKIKMEAKLDSENIKAAAKGEMILSNCSFAETNLFRMQKADIGFQVNYKNDSIEIDKFDLISDGAKLEIKGGLLIGDNIKINTRVKGTNLLLDELIKYAPQELLKELKLNQLAGNLNLDATINGTYSEIEFPKVDALVDLQNGNISMAEYPELKNISFNATLTNGILRSNESTQADFNSLHFETEKSKFDLMFSLLDIDHPKYNIKTNAKINIQEFSDYIPDTLIQSISGKIIANVTSKGELPDSIGNDFIDYLMANSTASIQFTDFNSVIDSSLSIKNFSGDLFYEPNKLTINKLNLSVPEHHLLLNNSFFESTFTGSVNDLANLSVNLANYQIQTRQSRLTGNASVHNLLKPEFHFTSDLQLNLNEIKSMLPDTTFNKLSGRIAATINTSGTLNLDSITDYTTEILFNKSFVNIGFEDISVEMPNDTVYKIENLSGGIKLSPEFIELNKLSGVLAGIEFGIDSTQISNVYKSVILNGNEQLLVDTRLSLGELDYQMFAPFMNTDTIVTNEAIEEKTENPSKNFTMQIKGVAKIKSFTYDSVFVENISTLFNISDSVYILDQFKFKAFNGAMNSSVRYSLKSDNRSVIETKHTIEKMDIHKLLSDFNNFEDFYEPSIKAENLSGLFSTEFYSRINMVGDSIIQDDIRVTGTINLEEGGVYDFEPASNLSKFTGIKELDNIKFKTLDSKIFIFKSAIFVPETSIASNAINIGAYGMQSFGEDYEYHLEIKLSDILFGKSKKQRRKESKAGEDFEDDRNMRQIVVYSIDGKNKNGFDNESLQGAMKNKIVLQQKILDFRFSPRLVNFDTKVYSDK